MKFRMKEHRADYVTPLLSVIHDLKDENRRLKIQTRKAKTLAKKPKYMPTFPNARVQK